MKDNSWQSRTELLLTSDNCKKLNNAHVMVAGLGGVGGYAIEQLARAGIGQLSLIDFDEVQISNINRQIIALNSTIGKYKADLIESRLKDINPDAGLEIQKIFLNEGNLDKVLNQPLDYVVDAIDTLTPKVDLIRKVVEKGMPLVSSMGSGGKMDPMQVRIEDVSNSHHCKFAYMVRKYLHRYNIRTGFKVVFSPEEIPESAIIETDGSNNKRSVVGTISYMPAIFGCICASVVIRDIISKE